MAILKFVLLVCLRLALLGVLKLALYAYILSLPATDLAKGARREG